MFRTSFIIFLALSLLICQEVSARRARTRTRNRSRVQIGLPITGKYRDQESDKYYNNQDVSCIIELNSNNLFQFFFSKFHRKSVFEIKFYLEKMYFTINKNAEK